MTSKPDVSVVVGAYNAMPYVQKCVSSVLEQTIGLDRLELIVVDDGSTDGTGPELDRLAAGQPAMRVVHQENSGGPAAPRNAGIELAQGRYIFFLDADDYLGVEALERMVAMADRNASDVVIGRRVGVGGRGTPQAMFKQNQDRADLYTSKIWQILSAQKLFRRELIDRLNLRFPDLRIGQDQPFTAMAYLHASVISVVADYECYYLVRRDDGGNNTTRHRDIRVWLDFVEYMVRLVAEQVPAGEKRDLLMQRHFGDELRRLSLSDRFLDATPEVRAEAVARTKALLDGYYNPRVAAGVPVDGRLRFELIQRGKTEELVELIRVHVAGERGEDVVEGGRAYAAYPFFRDPAVGIPDHCYEVTTQRLGVEKVTWADSGSPVLVLTGRLRLGPVSAKLTDGEGTTCRVAAVDREDGGFTAHVPIESAVDGRPLPAGRWRVSLEFAGADGAVVREVNVPRPAGLRRRWVWRGALPVVVSPRRTQHLTLAVAALVSATAVRAGLAAVRRRLARR